MEGGWLDSGLRGDIRAVIENGGVTEMIEKSTDTTLDRPLLAFIIDSGGRNGNGNSDEYPKLGVRYAFFGVD